ncbi:hypothetical protein HMPREF9406_0615 [Clostridium sp. HGF2]|nr:hypothetical protein HMPREF9406_0615 [Clostridium sp. HGF2]
MSTLNRNVPFFCYKCTDLETEEKKTEAAIKCERLCFCI